MRGQAEQAGQQATELRDSVDAVSNTAVEASADVAELRSQIESEGGSGGGAGSGAGAGADTAEGALGSAGDASVPEPEPGGAGSPEGE